MGSDLDALHALSELWDEYAADPAFDFLRSWKDPELGPLQLVPGEGSTRPRVVFVGEAPGAEEDRTGRPFVGASGQLLRSAIKKDLGLDPFQDCWITNIVKYRPMGNGTPVVRDQINSWPYVRREFEILRPRRKVVVPLGATAWSMFPGGVEMGISSVEGTVRYGRNDWAIIPMFHPSYILRQRAKLEARWRDRFKSVIREVIEAPE